jgi:hypothetical protein
LIIRHLRSRILLGVMAVAASLDAPHLAHEPLRVATAELVATPSTIAGAVTRAANAVAKSHVGFDTNIYPGDRAMDAWKRSGEYEWVGYYLGAPCHSDNSWTGKRARLVSSGWGLAVIYVGQQTWGHSYGPVTSTKRVLVRSKHGKKHYVRRTMTRKSRIPVATSTDGCSASFVNSAQGRIDARDAIAEAAREGFPAGTVVFLDVEYMPSVPDRMRDYYRAWTRAVLADGRYRAGIYAHTHNASTIYDDVSDAYASAGVDADPPFWIAGSSGFSTESAPTDVGHAFASVWQGMLDVVRTHNGVRLPVDISVARVASPSLSPRLVQ